VVAAADVETATDVVADADVVATLVAGPAADVVLAVGVEAGVAQPLTRDITTRIHTRKPNKRLVFMIPP
jgi:hypothetical protein